MEKLFIPIILGTNRAGRESEKMASFVRKKMEAHPEIETQFFDIRNFTFPHDDYGEGTKNLFSEYRDAIIRADGLVIVTPEYNHGYPGVLKTLLDTLLSEYRHKAAGIIGVSSGPWGGTRMIENLLPVLRELGLVAISKSVNIPRVHEAFDEQGNPKDDVIEERLNGFLKELIWMSHALKWGRENLKT